MKTVAAKEVKIGKGQKKEEEKQQPKIIVANYGLKPLIEEISKLNKTPINGILSLYITRAIKKGTELFSIYETSRVAICDGLCLRDAKTKKPIFTKEGNYQFKGDNLKKYQKQFTELANMQVEIPISRMDANEDILEELGKRKEDRAFISTLLIFLND